MLHILISRRLLSGLQTLSYSQTRQFTLVAEIQSGIFHWLLCRKQCRSSSWFSPVPLSVDVWTVFRLSIDHFELESSSYGNIVWWWYIIPDRCPHSWLHNFFTSDRAFYGFFKDIIQCWGLNLQPFKPKQWTHLSCFGSIIITNIQQSNALFVRSEMQPWFVLLW